MRLPPWHVRWPLLALAFQVVPWVGFQCVARSVHADTPRVTIGTERPLTLALLAVSAVGSWVFGGVAVYLLLRRARPCVAIPLLLLCCVPALLGAALYAHALLVFLTLV
jgi:hypothetical protein